MIIDYEQFILELRTKNLDEFTRKGIIETLDSCEIKNSQAEPQPVFACGHCKDCKYWDADPIIGESNEGKCERILWGSASQYINKKNWDEMPGAFIWTQTETEDGLGNERIGLDAVDKEAYINIVEPVPIEKYYSEKMECYFVTTKDFGCMLFESIFSL